MISSRKLMKSAAILTLAGIITRIMGFFFRIFLSHAFGEENVGLYQLIFPVYALCISLCTSGIQTALSGIVAEKAASGKRQEASAILTAALSITLLLSIVEIILVQKNAEYISIRFLGDPRCTGLLVIISYALPFAAIHSCICGYSLGLQRSVFPAASQLVEQFCRIFFVIVLFLLIKDRNDTPSVTLAAAGIAAGEFAAAAFSLRFLSSEKVFCRRNKPSLLLSGAGKLIRLSAPLTANRVTLTLLQSIEAASIPACLKAFGLSGSESLKLYGVLTGMALPCILFPSALTNSVGTVLMPAVSSAKVSGNRSTVTHLLKKAAGSCFILGLACCLGFLIFGNLMGELMFHSASAGRFIITLAWICPFLYTNTALLSAITGLGKTSCTFIISTAGLLVRITAVFLAIPVLGIQGYLTGLLCSQFLVSILAVLFLYRIITFGSFMSQN